MLFKLNHQQSAKRRLMSKCKAAVTGEAQRLTKIADLSIVLPTLTSLDQDMPASACTLCHILITTVLVV